MSEIEELKKEIEKLKKYYKEELDRKEQIIDELKEHNKILMGSALLQSAKMDEMNKMMQKKVKTLEKA
jgi:hypothetical protein